MSDADWRKEIELMMEGIIKGREEDRVVQALFIQNVESIMNTDET